MKKNALLMIPKRNPKYEWEDKDKIFLVMKREGTFHKLMNKVFKTPLNPAIELDEIGSFVWKNCDGVKNLHEISEIMKDRFGESIEPAYDRLLLYVGMLKNNKLIKLE